MRCTSILCAFLWTLVITEAKCAAQADTLVGVQRGRPLLVRADVNWTLGIAATEFFRDVQYYLGARASSFDIPTGVSATIASFQLSDIAFGLSSGYTRAAVRETYGYDPRSRPDPVGPAQTITQTFLLSSIPTMITVDYHPIRRQFSGYVGVGLGVSANHFYWEEALSPSTESGARQSGIRYDAWQASPLVHIRSGLFLGFDQRWSGQTRPGLFVEAGYMWIPMHGRYFELTAKSMANQPQQLARDYTIHAGGFVLRMGLELLLNAQ